MFGFFLGGEQGARGGRVVGGFFVSFGSFPTLKNPTLFVH